MGVIKGTKELFGYPAVDELEQILVAESSSEDEAAVAPPRRPRRATNQRQCNNIIHLQYVQDCITSRRKGGKQARRNENLRELINMVEKEDLDMDFSIFEPSMSVFAELLAEREKMEAWNDFVNSSEEDQAELLQTGQVPTDRDLENTVNNNGGDLDDWEQVPPTDNRSDHPSFSAEACFQKLDKNIRSMLKRRHRPMGMLLSLENDIIGFFREWPTSVYVSKLANSYERLMLHALCQYLDLNSKSFDSEGRRQTQVDNSLPTFTPPPVLLTQYLDRAL